ncbi:MAG: recombinase family protein [Candidatus Saccharimonadales bacterium]
MDDYESSGKLIELLRNQLSPEAKEERVDPTTVRYAMYVRKSTESEDRQVQSIDDQIKDCYDSIIQQFGIPFKPSDIFREEKSAKESGERPAFNKMMEAIKDGEYDGIIAWHYDRLARNMKEAGEIIDLIDKGTIRDLKLARAVFENTPNGKMILGINFVLSKHYSDHLSESVLRGNKSSTLKGRVLKHVVHGYSITEDDRRLVVDGKNYDIIKCAFRMRIDDKAPLRKIAEYINSMGYKCFRLSTGHTRYKFDNDEVSKLLRNPIYAGIYTYGTNIVNMTDLDPEFQPMVSEREYLDLNGDNLLSYAIRHRAKRSSKRDVSDFLRQFVICSHCGKTMGTSVTTKKTGSYFRFRCDNKACEYRNSGPAGSVIRDYAVDFLKRHQFTTESNYQRYKQDMVEYIAQESDELKSKKKSAEVTLARSKQNYENARSMAAQPGSTELTKHYSPDYLDRLLKDSEQAQENLDDINDQMIKLSGAIMTYKEFLELYKNASELLRLTYGMSLADEIIRIFFSNFTVTGVPYGKTGKQRQWSVTNHCLASPFDEFVENNQFIEWSG